MNQNENKQLSPIIVDVQMQPNDLFDAWISTEGSSGAHYHDVTIDSIAENVAELLDCLAQAAKKEGESK